MQTIIRRSGKELEEKKALSDELAGQITAAAKEFKGGSMANAREIQSRIKSIQDTRKITSAMYLISSTKMKKSKSFWQIRSRTFTHFRA